MTDKCKCFSIHKTKISFKKCCMDTVSPDMLSLLLFRSHPSMRTPSWPVCWWQAPTSSSLPALPTSGTPSYWLFKSPPVQRVLVSFPGSFWYLLQRLSISFTNVKISKPGELIHLAPSITLIVRFVDVKQSSFKLAMCLMSK